MAKTFIPRPDLVARLVERDGLVCMHPDCGRSLDLNLEEGPLQATIDHREPQVWCKENGWTNEQIWDLSNLDLMHKKCNADKGSRRYIDGVLEPKPISKFRYRRAKRAERPEVCTACEAGRKLDQDEVCASCGSGPMPFRFPRWKKLSAKDCDHALFWCAMCASGVIERVSAADMIFHHGEGGEGSNIEDEIAEALAESEVSA